ncbi:Protein S-acyltransferase 10 [Abeliophyllum distichum]|uniref:S-acyltransferase n=1 Tax=Abeliophyllum distichum TaxID=126358 RepID=A0ABD1SUM0_9LAMI
MGAICGGFLRDTWDRATDRCFRFFPCLSDPARRSTLCLKVALVTLHLIFPGVLFAFDKDLIDRTREDPWYTAIYLLLFIATLAQYFLTSGTSPGYVLDAQKAVDERDALVRRTSLDSKQPASSKNGSVDHLLELGRALTATLCSPQEQSIVRIVINVFFNLIIHCVWLGTCIGQGNHCRFWWYILEETTLALWTSILYIVYLKSNITKAWWVDVIMILLLGTLSISLIFLLLLLLFHSYLVVTNQTTYELVRRRRVPYLRAVPHRVYPFSKGLCRNLYLFCCARNSILQIEPMPSAQELEEKSKPYTCLDILSCRCC